MEQKLLQLFVIDSIYFDKVSDRIHKLCSVFLAGGETCPKRCKNVRIGAHHTAQSGALLGCCTFFNRSLGRPSGLRACFGLGKKANVFYMFMLEAWVKMRRPNRFQNAKGCNNVEKLMISIKSSDSVWCPFGVVGFGVCSSRVPDWAR